MYYVYVTHSYYYCFLLNYRGLVMSMVLSLTWIVLMRFIAGIMVWISIIAVLGFSAFGKCT